MKRSLVLFCLLVAFLLPFSRVEGQNWKEAPLFGTVDLTAGFMPDPVSRALRAGGNDTNPVTDCTGYINAAAPDYALNYTSGTSTLYLYARAGADVTLLVRDPSGRWHCSDDWDGTDPMVELSSPASGIYSIWVGTYEAGAPQDATLYFTEITPSTGTVGTGFGEGMPDVSAVPVYETLELSAGFMPDPVSRALQAGGSDENPVAGAGCAGYINLDAPDYDLNYSAGTMPLYIYATADVDLTLVVNDADGNWHCSDDANGTNPLIHLPSPPTGNYNIWVGTYDAGSLQPATLFISERAPW